MESSFTRETGSRSLSPQGPQGKGGGCLIRFAGLPKGAGNVVLTL